MTRQQLMLIGRDPSDEGVVVQPLALSDALAVRTL